MAFDNESSMVALLSDSGRASRRDGGGESVAPAGARRTDAGLVREHHRVHGADGRQVRPLGRGADGRLVRR